VSRRLAARFVHGSAPPNRSLEAVRALPRAASPGALILASAIPVLFLHVAYQPSISVSVASTKVTAYLSDFAVLAVVLVALASALRGGVRVLRYGRPLWLVGGLFLFWVGLEVVYGHVHAADYALGSHGTSALKFLEYALLGPAVVLLLRRRADLHVVLWALTLWSAAATTVAIAQFFGAPVGLANLVGQREASFVGYSDFAALSVGTLLVGIVGIAWARSEMGRLGVVAAASGALGTILAGAMAGVLGAVTAFAALTIILWSCREVAPRRLVAAGAIVAAVVLGGVAIRGNDLQAFARFVGTSTTANSARAKHVQTYSQRTLLSWIGYEIWKDHALLGVGWQGSNEPVNFEPYLPAAHRRFPSIANIAFPAAGPGRHYGVQNAWVESLADMGVVGFALWLSLFLAVAWLSARAMLKSRSVASLLGLTATAALVWLWTAQGIVAGIPLDALTFVAFGLAAACPAEA
jgi:O-Antigen ligase